MTEATAELFESHINQDIQVQTPTGPESWRIVSVTRLPSHPFREHPFAAYFAAPIGSTPKQGDRSAVFSGGEVVDFFAVPIAATNAVVSYEVIFN